MSDLAGADANNPSGVLPESGDERADEHTDAELVARALRDRRAFAEVYRRHLPRVYRYLLAQLGDKAAAEELTSQTFLAALEGLAGYRGDGPFAAWLLRIARNKLADAQRRRRPLVSLEAAAELPATDAPPERAALARLELEEVACLVRGLTPERAEALTLRIFAGLSLAEAGTVMGRSEDAVKMLVHRAIRDLRERMARQSEADA